MSLVLCENSELPLVYLQSNEIYLVSFSKNVWERQAKARSDIFCNVSMKLGNNLRYSFRN